MTSRPIWPSVAGLSLSLVIWVLVIACFADRLPRCDANSAPGPTIGGVMLLHGCPAPTREARHVAR